MILSCHDSVIWPSLHAGAKYSQIHAETIYGQRIWCRPWRHRGAIRSDSLEPDPAGGESAVARRRPGAGASVMEFNEGAFEQAAQAAHDRLGLASPATLNQMLAEFGF